MAINVQQVEAYIREAARKRGIDPDVAVRAAKSEGLAPGVWQSNVNHPTRGREPSYGPYQLLVGGENGWPTGMGNAFMKETGLDPRDPANVLQTVDYALDVASREGWQQWYGPKHAGIGRWDGVKGAKPAGLTPPVELSPEAQGFVNNNPQPGGFGPGISDPNGPVFGSMAPPTGGGAPRDNGFPSFVADYANSPEPKSKGEIIGNALSQIEVMPAPRPSPHPGGPSDAQATALLKLMQDDPNGLGRMFQNKRLGRG